VNRFKIRLPALAVLASIGLLAATLTGCGADRSLRWPPRSPPSMATGPRSNNVALRDIHIRATQSGDFIEPGKTVDLVLVAINQSPDITDRLVGITSDIGTVSLAGGDGGCRRRDAVHRYARWQEPGARTDGRQQRGKATVTLAQRITTARLQLHLQLREGRAGHRDGANFGRAGSAAVLTATFDGLSHRACRTRPIRSTRGKRTLAVPVLGMPPCHRQVGGTLHGMRHVGHRR